MTPTDSHMAGRRSCVRDLASGFAGLALADLLDRDGFFDQTAAAQISAGAQPPAIAGGPPPRGPPPRLHISHPMPNM